MTLARNRSMPDFAVLPVLNYRDVRGAVVWLCRAFGARERLRIGEHRAQLLIGEGAFIAARSGKPTARGPWPLPRRGRAAAPRCATPP